MLKHLASALTPTLTAAGWPATVLPAEQGERDGQPVPLVRSAGTRREFTYPARDAAFAYLRAVRPLELRPVQEGPTELWEILLPLRLVAHRPRPTTEARLAAELALQLALALPPALRALRAPLKLARVHVEEVTLVTAAQDLVRQEHGAAVAGPPPGDYLALDFTAVLTAEGRCLRTLCP